MDRGDRALDAFKKMNPAQYERFPDALFDLIRYLADRFDPVYRVHQIQSDVENGMLETARERILDKIVDFLRRDKRRAKVDREMIAFYAEGWLMWFLEYERGIPAYAKISEREKEAWATLRFVFELDQSVTEDDESDEFEEIVKDISNAEMEKVSKSPEIASNASLVPGTGSERVVPDVLYLQNRIRRNITKSQAFDELQFLSTELPNIGPVDRANILNRVLSEARQHFPRFGPLFETVDAEHIKESLESRLNTSVRTLCEKGLFDIEHLKQLGQDGYDPAKIKEAGIYLHILWLKQNPKKFWLYVGQSVCLQDRIRDHYSRRHQGTHFCLHYYIWNNPDPGKIDSLFVTLYIDNEHGSSNQQLLLNLAEMWLCCIFQTLTSLHLDRYLPENADKSWAGCHLNVALPLWQSFSDSLESQASAISGREAFTDFLQSPEASVRQWAKSLRDGFNDLRNSPDYELRHYYKKHISHSLQLATAVRLENSRNRLSEFLSGKELPVNVYTEKRWGKVCDMSCGMFLFRISRKFDLNLGDGDMVVMHFDLAETEHPMKYACQAEKTDPACRLAISVSGSDSQGQFHVWLESKTGKLLVRKMNSLVHILEGYSLEERRTFRRRWFLISSQDADGKYRPRTIYT